MKQRIIGHMILRGKTSKDIQEKISDFPSNPSINYFTNLGYKESSAKRYCYLLKRNEKLSTAENPSAGTSAKTSVDIPDISKDTNTGSCLVKSSHANCNNLLVDTCSLNFYECTKLIDSATQVTFINATLKEMDNVSKKCHSPKQMNLFKNIKIYTSQILLQPDKFLLSNFDGFDDEKYVDEILLQYLEILPKQIRPTLLTADKNLACKAQLHGFEYIFCYNYTDMIFLKKLGYGINLFTIRDNLNYKDDFYIEYRGFQKLFIIHDGKQIPYTFGKFKVEPGDSIFLQLKSKGNISEYRIEI